MTAKPTLKLRPRTTIQFSDMTTLRTFTRSIMRINSQDRDSRQSCLVVDKSSQLIERPTMQLHSYFATGPDPKADTLEVFKDYRPLRALRFQNDLLTDLMIQVGGKAVFFAGAFLKKSPSGLCAFRLQFLSKPTMPLAKIARVRTIEGLSLAIGGDASNSKIDTEKTFWIVSNRLDHFDGSEEEPFASAINQIGFSLARFKQFLLMCATNKWNFRAALKSPDRNIVCAVAQDAVVVGNRAIATKNTLRLFVELVGIGYFSHKPYNNLCRKAIFFLERTIYQALQLKRSKGFLLPGNSRCFVGRSVGTIKRFEQRLRLLFGWFQLQADRQFHSDFTLAQFYIGKQGGGASSPRINPGASAPSIG